jgi:DNA invertase Pin-like site-specific DNA recombinase
MKVAIYARVSTGDQSTEMQIAELQLECARRKWETTVIYRDVVSSARENRPALDQLWEGANEGNFDCVLVWKFDRFARSLSQLLASLEAFQRLGIQFVSLKDQCDTTSPQGKLLFQIMGAVAEFERFIDPRTRPGGSG